ncbi:MAG TPA: amidohydrolase family protein [Bryobacteraceae bacterium]|nr:amidohydrolase family protein [Bryobacteraceae bacterium]
MADHSCTTISRRQFLPAIWAAGGLLASGVAWPQTPSSKRLDLHHHFASPKFKALLAAGKRQGWEVFQPYDPTKDLEAMEKGGVATAFLSVTTPGLYLGDEFNRTERDRATAMARDMNDYGARLVRDHQGRFGLFAALPLPDIDASLREIAYAFETLRADGVGLLTSYGNHWLGEKMFEPVFDELNRRNAVVFVHPTDAPCCHNLANANPATLEWLTDTARSILSMIAADPRVVTGRGASEASPATRYANCKFIWSHGGGALIGVASRVVGSVTEKDLSGTPPAGSRLYHIRRFFYDTAGSANPIVMQGIARLAGASQIVFGTDYPFGNPAGLAEGLDSVGFTAAQLRAIDRENALRIFPQYA